MSETIWRATDADGDCFDYHDDKPIWDGDTYGIGYGNNWNRYHGANQPPPGECWEYRLTRKGDIDTDGEPIGWKIVGIGKDGSVLCEKGNGQRRRYSFGDGAKEQPSGEAWERLLNVVADYVRNVGIVGPRGERIKEAWKAYEAAQSAEPSDQQATIEVLTKELSISDQVIDERNATIAELRSELDETRTERHAYKSRLREFCQRLVDMVGAEGPEDVQGMLDKVNAELHRLKQNIDSMSANLADKEGFLNSAGDEIERLTKERDEAVTELRSLSTHSGQVTTEQINVIAELQEQIRKLKEESELQSDAIYERNSQIAILRAKLAKPEMSEVVRELVEWTDDIDSSEKLRSLAQAVREHYAPPFKVHGPGVYFDSKGDTWRLVIKDRGGMWLGYRERDCLSEWFPETDHPMQSHKLTTYLRPLEG